MRRIAITLLITLVMTLIQAGETEGQALPALEIRGGLNLPVGDFSGSPGIDAESEAGFGGDLIVPLNPRLSVYAGAGREMFGCAQCEGDDEFTTTGFEAGGKILFTREGSVLPWVKAGLTYHKAKLKLGAVEGESDWGPGLQVAAGLDIPLGRVLSFSPAVRYQTYNADFHSSGLDLFDLKQDVSFLSLDLGLHIHFVRE